MAGKRKMPSGPGLPADETRVILHITGQKRAEQALRESESRLRATFDGAAIGMAWVSPHGRILESNGTLQAMLGYSREELKDRRVAELTHPDDCHVDRNPYREVLAGKRHGYQVEKRYIRKDGAILWGRLTVSVVRDAAGQVQFSVGALLDITEQKQADEILRATNQRLQSVLDSMTDAHFVMDSQWRLREINPVAERQIFHRRAAELIGKVVLEEYPQMAGTELFRQYHTAMVTGLPVHCEIKSEADGWFEIHAYPRDGQLEIYARDITARKRAEEDNRRSEARLESLLRIAQHRAESIQGLLDFALEEAIALTSSKIGYIYHYDEEKREFSLNTWSREVMGQCAIVEPHTVYQLEQTGLWGEAVRQARPIIVNDFQSPHPLKKGYPAGHAPLRKFMTVPILVDGHIVGVVGVANKQTDYDSADVRQLTLLMDSVWKITDRQQAAEDLQEANQRAEESLARLQAVVESMTDALIIADPAGNLIYHNPASIALHGYHGRQEAERPADKVGCLWEIRDLQGRLLSPQEWPIARALRGERFSGCELSVRRPDTGRAFIASYNGTPVHDRHGQMILAIVTIRDVTEIKRAEAQLKGLNETLERRVTERTAVAEDRARQLQVLASQMIRAEERERRRVAQILHEHFQQLLVGAKFDVSLLRSQLCGRPDCKAPPVLQRVNELLDQSIAESRSLTVELSPPILYAAGLAEALRWLGAWMREKHGLQVDVEADKAAEPPSEDMRILLFQGVKELLFNVAKHAGVKRAALRMDRSEQGEVRITVTDDGGGFVLQDVQKNKGSGGFGIFSLRERLEFQGGQLRIDSCPGKGTAVVLLVPGCTTDGGAQAGGGKTMRPTPRQKEPAIDVAATMTAGKIRILLADDHVVVRDGLARLLQMQPGMEVIGQAADGQQAVDLALELRPDVVLMDVSMPRLSGIEATRCIVSQMPGIRVVGLSMHGDEGVAAAMAEAGAVGYVRKTAPAESLIAAIRAAVG